MFWDDFCNPEAFPHFFGGCPPSLGLPRLPRTSQAVSGGSAGPKGPLGLLAPLKSRFAPGSMLGIPQNGRLHLLFHAQNLPKWPAIILGGSGHEIRGVADRVRGFRAWITERSDFFKGPKGPLGPERSDFLRGPKAPRAPWARRDNFCRQFIAKERFGRGEASRQTKLEQRLC